MDNTAGGIINRPGTSDSTVLKVDSAVTEKITHTISNTFADGIGGGIGATDTLEINAKTVHRCW